MTTNTNTNDPQLPEGFVSNSTVLDMLRLEAASGNPKAKLNLARVRAISEDKTLSDKNDIALFCVFARLEEGGEKELYRRAKQLGGDLYAVSRAAKELFNQDIPIRTPEDFD